jgi:hypothetical protein
MTVNELLACDVVDPTGQVVGHVHDVTFVLRDEGATPVYEIRYLMFLPGIVGVRLGYGYGEMHGPWPIATVMRRVVRTRSRATEGAHVTDISGGRVHIDVAADSLPSVLDVVEARQ